MSDEKNASQVGAPIDPVLARASGAWAFEIYEGGIAPSAKPSEARLPKCALRSFRGLRRSTSTKMIGLCLRKRIVLRARLTRSKSVKSGEPFIAHP